MNDEWLQTESNVWTYNYPCRCFTGEITYLNNIYYGHLVIRWDKHHKGHQVVETHTYSGPSKEDAAIRTHKEYEYVRKQLTQ